MTPQVKTTDVLVIGGGLAGERVLYYQATVRPTHKNTSTQMSAPPTIIETQFTEAQNIAAQTLLSEVRARSADSETFTVELLSRLNAPYVSSESGENVAVLLGKKPGLSKKLNIAMQMLALVKLPARIVNGIRQICSFMANKGTRCCTGWILRLFKIGYQIIGLSECGDCFISGECSSLNSSTLLAASSTCSKRAI